MNLQIEPATTRDLGALLQWRMEVLHAVFSIPFDTPIDALREANRRYYETELPRGGHLACFARLDGVRAGCGGVCFYPEMPSPDNPTGRCAYLMNIYTKPAFRGRGVGRAVVGWLVNEAKRRGISKIYLETSDAGRALYRALGFVDMPDMLKLPQAKTPGGTQP